MEGVRITCLLKYWYCNSVVHELGLESKLKQGEEGLYLQYHVGVELNIPCKNQTRLSGFLSIASIQLRGEAVASTS